MASPQLVDFRVRLGIEGNEKLERFSSQFRELGRVADLSGAEIDSFRQRIRDFTSEGGRSEQLIRGQVEALKALRGQADLAGTTYRQLTRDISDLEAELRGSTPAMDRQRDAILRNVAANRSNTEALQANMAALQRIQGATRSGSAAYEQLGRDILAVRTQIETATDASRAHFSSLEAFLGVRPDAVLRQWQAYRTVLEDTRATAEQLATAQLRLRQLGGAPFIGQRRRIAEQAQMVADPEYQRRFGLEGRTLSEVPLPNTTAALTQRLQELQFQLANTERGTAAYVQTALALASVQREASATTQGLGQALVEQLAAGRSTASARNLRAAIGQLNAEMQELDTTTTEGGAEFARLANQARTLQQQLDRLSQSYTHVSDAARQAAAAQSSAASRAVTANYMNRAAVRQQEAAFAAAAAAALRQAQATPLLLPAAGQTSAPGTGMNISGGARYGYPSPNLGPLVSLPGPAGSTARERINAYKQGLAGAGPSAAEAAASDAARRAYISESAALRARSEAQEAAALRMQQLEQAATPLNKANAKSLEQLRALRQSWGELRDAVETTSPAFKQATTQLEQIDKRIERTQRRRMTGGQFAQAAGATITGGIFGGVEGFLGGAIGTAVGGVQGAFAGAAIGGTVGMMRQSIGETTAYAAEINRLRIALGGVVSSMDDYATALQTTEQIANRFNLPLSESTQRFTQLAASVVGSGRSVADAKLTFESITAAILATGGGVEQVNGALTAASQVFSKNKVTAEEWRNQIGDRLPGATAVLAESMGVTAKQLDKLFESGSVTIDDFLKAMTLLRERYGKTADRMAQSSEQAGARMTRAFEQLRITVGTSFSPAGAAFQDFTTGAIKNVNALIERLIQLRLLTPGPGYTYGKVITGEMPVEDVKNRLKELKERQAVVGGPQGVPRFPGLGLGGIARLATKSENDPRKIAEEIKTLEEVLRKYNLVQQTLSKATQQLDTETKQSEREAAAKRYLDLIEQREESLYEARRSREEALAELRKSTAREVEQLERRFADERRTIERDIRDIRTQRADTAEDNERRLRIARGESADVVNAAQRVADIYRKERDDNQAMSDKIADAERNQAQTIADFQRKTAEEIGRANETYAKRVGEIQRKFAQEQAHLLDEGSKRQAQRMTLAAQLVSLQQERQARTVSGVLLPPIGYRGAVPLYGVDRLPIEELAPSFTSDTANFLALEVDKKIGKIQQQLLNLDRQRPIPAAPALPTTPAPRFSGVRLDSAAQTTASRSNLLAEQRQQSASTRQQAMEREYVGSIAELTQQERQLQLRQQAQLDIALFMQRGYGEPVARQIVELRQLTVAAFDNLASTYAEQLNQIAATDTEALADAEQLFKASSDALRTSYQNAEGLTLELERQNELLRFRQDMRIGQGATEGLREYVAAMGTAREASKQLALTGIKGVENAIVDLATTGTANFREFAKSMIQDTIRVITQQLILRNVLSLFNLAQPAALPGLGGGTSSFLSGANVNAGVDFSGVPKFAQGGIASGPMSGYPATLHGTEAVIPLSASRTIPVQLQGGAGAAPVINISVDASGTAVQGDQGASQDLARDLAAVVDDRLVYHRRRGGLLDPAR